MQQCNDITSILLLTKLSNNIEQFHNLILQYFIGILIIALIILYATIIIVYNVSKLKYMTPINIVNMEDIEINQDENELYTENEDRLNPSNINDESKED